MREDRDCLTHNFHVYVRSVLSSRISNHNRVDPLVLPLGPLNGEDAVTFGGLHVDPAVSLCDHLRGQQLHFAKMGSSLIPVHVSLIECVCVSVCVSCGGSVTCPESLTS